MIGGGVGCAIAYPTAKALYNNGTEVTVISGFRNKDLVILQEEFAAVSSKSYLVSDDGSTGKKGLVTNVLEELIEQGEQFDEVIAIGPLPMMKFVCLPDKEIWDQDGRQHESDHDRRVPACAAAAVSASAAR